MMTQTTARYKQSELEELVANEPYSTGALFHVDDIRGMQQFLRVLTGKHSFLVPDGQGAEMYLPGSRRLPVRHHPHQRERQWRLL